MRAGKIRVLPARALALLCASLLLPGLSACTAPQAEIPAGKAEIVVGRVAPLTGSLASFGTGTPQWEEAAIRYINEKLGGVHIEALGKKLPLRLVTADSQSSAEGARRAAARLIEEDGIDVMITSGTSDTVNPVSATCERNRIPCFSVDAPADTWLEGGPYTYSFHAFFNTENELSCFVDAWDLVESNGRVGVLCANDPEGIEVATAIDEYATYRGYSAIDPGRYSIGTGDYTAIIQRLAEIDCDLVVGVMATSDFATFWQQCHQFGYVPKAVTVAKATLFKADVDALGEGLGDGVISEVWWTPEHPFHSSLTGQSAEELGADWMALTGEDYAPGTVGYKHANIEILYDILNRAASLDPEEILKAADATDLETIVGQVRFNDEHVAVMNLVTGQWVLEQGGGWRQEIIENRQIPGIEITEEVKILSS